MVIKVIFAILLLLILAFAIVGIFALTIILFGEEIKDEELEEENANTTE